MNADKIFQIASTLTKGDHLPVSELESITGYKRRSAEFGLAVLRLKSKLLKALEAKGKKFTLAVIKGELWALDDRRAAKYNARQFFNGGRKQRRSLKRANAVDVRNLNREERAEHERNLLRFAASIEAARHAFRTPLEPEPHRRSMP